MRILVVNAGSSSLKLRVVADGDVLEAEVDLPGPPVDAAVAHAAREAIRGFGAIDAVGHRVVHGGTDFTAPVMVRGDILTRLAALTPLAALHQPGSLAGLRIALEVLPDAPQVACFDTAFHTAIPAEAATYALPAAWRARWPLRKFGFHGLSHAWTTRRSAELLGVDAGAVRLVTCHLGAGASLAAVAAGRSVDTTMGFTPLDGLVMATRSGSVDPGLVLWLQEHGGLSAADVSTGLERSAGLQGLAGTGDMRAVLEAADDPSAALAIAVYLHRLRAGIAAMAAALGGIDALAFTGGVGEHAPAIRAGAVDGLAFLGLAIDGRRNAAAGGGTDARIEATGSAAAVLVIASREELEIARQVRALLG